MVTKSSVIIILGWQLALTTLGSIVVAEQEAPAVRGAYLVRAGGCVSCHTDKTGKGATFAGGRALKTSFGTFYSPNITPDKKTGIGSWNDAKFLNALQRGIRPDGGHYFPIFPYPTYTKISETDALAIKAYLFSLKPVKRRNRAHDVSWWLGWRWSARMWRWLYFKEGRFKPILKRDIVWNRGAYLVEALAHCGECHTPRNSVGVVKRAMWMAGTVDGPDGEKAPNITSDAETGIGGWSENAVANYLKTGTKPDYEFSKGAMREAIADGLSHLTKEDLTAIARYIKALIPVRNHVGR